MKSNRVLFIIFLSLLGLFASAREVRDTLRSKEEDYLILSYDITQIGNQYDVTFESSRKYLRPDSKYDIETVVILFFDKIGSFEDLDITSKSIRCEGFKFHSDKVRYYPSSEGYYLWENNDHKPSPLKFELLSEEGEEVLIPVYLAHYEKSKIRRNTQGKYHIFSYCGDLRIRLIPPKKVEMPAYESRVVSQTIVTQQEEEMPSYDIENIRNRIKEFRKWVETTTIEDEDEIPTWIKEENSSLSKLITEIPNKRLKDEAKAADEEYRKLITKIKNKKEEKNRLRQDSIRQSQEAKEQEERLKAENEQKKKEKKSLWMIIGGAFLAVLGFVGNQLFQNSRNARNQKNMMELQQSVARRAENEAKRRVRSVVRNQVHKAKGDVRRKVRKELNNGVKQIGKKKINNKNNKRFSI